LKTKFKTITKERKKLEAINEKNTFPGCPTDPRYQRKFRQLTKPTQKQVNTEDGGAISLRQRDLIMRKVSKTGSFLMASEPDQKVKGGCSSPPRAVKFNQSRQNSIKSSKRGIFLNSATTSLMPESIMN
jgi:hypothetical protein